MVPAPLHELRHRSAYIDGLKDSAVDRLLLERAILPFHDTIRFGFLEAAEAGMDPPVWDLMEEVVREILIAVVHSQRQPASDVGVHRAVQPAEALRDGFQRRGAAADLKLVLLDGAPVYAPFHLNGLLDAFTDGVLEDASLYIGGTPARYDGGLSYVLDLDVR